METILEWAEEINRSKKLVIVEGIKDKAALQKLGIVKIISLNKPLFEIIEKIVEREKEVIILTDFDAEGKKLYWELKQGLERFGVKIDNKFREFLQKNTKISSIEGLAKYWENNA